MDQKDKALKIAVTAVLIMAFAMFAYYWVSWRARKTDNDVNFSEKADAGPKEEKSELTGVYSATEAVEGGGYRFAFFSINRREDGSGFFGTAKVDPIGSETEGSVFLQCNDVNIADKDFFVKCSEPKVGQISFVGEWSKASGAIQVSGKVLWTKDAAEIANKATNLTHSGG